MQLPCIKSGGGDGDGDGEVLIVTADTSYSERATADMRGGAAAAVWLEGSPDSLDRTCLSGQRTLSSGGLSYSFCAEEDECVGRPYTRTDEDGTGREWWVRLPVGASSYVLSTPDHASPYPGQVAYSEEGREEVRRHFDKSGRTK